MMTTDEIERLRAAASAVVTDGLEPRVQISARQAARCLAGVVRLAALEHGVDAMRRACAELAADVAATGVGSVGAAMNSIRLVARGIAPISGPRGLRAALAFWASETDPAVWRQVESDAA